MELDGRRCCFLQAVSLWSRVGSAAVTLFATSEGIGGTLTTLKSKGASL